jgi:HD-GYP domain-containing protein (c-di-GMP phosphodiesterase class II)
MLRTRDAGFFNRRLENITAILTHQLNVNPDQALLALFYLSDKDAHHYSATHCLLVCVICALTASSVLHWSDSDVDLLMRGALTMNLGMADLQDALIFQVGPTDISQQFLIAEHPNLAVHILEVFGVGDKDWLTIVRLHHKAIQEPLQSAFDSDRLIGLLNRADIFAAKLAPRNARDAQPASVAMKSIYLGAQAKTDAIGAAIIKAVGIYRPGSFVKLASGEVALVLRREGNTTTPAVAVVLNRDSVPVVAMAIRDTSDKRYAVVASVPSSTVKVTLNLERMLDLSRA